ncbi:hypothetical protein PHLGIDRAFT_307417 [Phlebiopsis gigantea 11061_1 CR5-6]|uniref:N-acetyltransferase domain-containing protein n=1 Tax=Phlebiopsis gigantea (strain 11061_1 CR5-6) TaxID=745531 RepID=A0A0C3SDG3_PHLG1|nr:hypothetical protein PHLGIDRAFT_307417 [Phlebiopsis gigantea 11061_1 CR5-6]
MSSPPRLHLVGHPTDEQIEAATAVCVRAFQDETAVRAMSGGDAALAHLLFASMLRTAREGGTLHLVTRDGEVLAVGLWFGPGRKMFATEEQRRLGFDVFMARLSPAMQGWWKNEYGKDVALMKSDILGTDGDLNSWYAQVIATDPIHQGKGYGGMLIQEARRLAREDSSSLALATTNRDSASWYEHQGFTTLGVRRIQGSPVDPQLHFDCIFMRFDDP